MRAAFAIGFVIALALLVAACNDDDRPNDVPRTVPPLSDGAAATTPAQVKGVGPTIEAVAANIVAG
jgi:hypothetical protein